MVLGIQSKARGVSTPIILAILVAGATIVCTDLASAGDVLTNWSGFYIGANTGAAWSGNGTLNVDPTITGGALVPGSAAQSPSGAFAGAQIGYNWHPGPFVFGLEADFDLANIKDNTASFAQFPLALGSSESMLLNFGTLRGRVGINNGPFLFYGTGGLAVGEVKDATNTSFSNGSGAAFFGNFGQSKTSTEVGWAAGAGVEYALSSSVSLKAEYLHLDLGSTILSGSVPGGFGNAVVTTSLNVEHQYDTVRAGLNYRFGGNAGTAGWVPSGFIPAWGGFYAGLNSGAGWTGRTGNFGVEAINGIFSGSSSSTDSLSGAVGGAQIGYNWQVTNYLIGIEADADASGIHGRGSVVASDPAAVVNTAGITNDRLDYFGTVRGRLGYTLGSWLAYGTGGFAFGRVKDRVAVSSTDGTSPSIPTMISTSEKDATGWTAGGGAELALAPNWTAKTEYLHVDLGSSAFPLQGPPPFGGILGKFSMHHTYDIVRAGVNYRFGS
jgi:outer membrane immunogenic protein